MHHSDLTSMNSSIDDSAGSARRMVHLFWELHLALHWSLSWQKCSYAKYHSYFFAVKSSSEMKQAHRKTSTSAPDTRIWNLIDTCTLLWVISWAYIQHHPCHSRRTAKLREQLDTAVKVAVVQFWTNGEEAVTSETVTSSRGCSAAPSQTILGHSGDFHAWEDRYSS